MEQHFASDNLDEIKFPGAKFGSVWLVGGIPDLRSEASRSVLLAKWFFGGLRYHGFQQTTHFPETSVFLALPPQAGRPTNHSFLEKVWILTTWPNKTSGSL